MNIEDTFYLGFISKKTGYKGELTGIFDVDHPLKYQNLESVFLLIEGKLVPFFIEKIFFQPNSNQAVIKFKDTGSKKKAEELINCEMYLPLEQLPTLSGNQFYFHEVEGFHVYDIEHGYIGELIRIIDHPGNPVMQIKKGINEILIPANDEFIQEVNRELKKMLVTTPEGLLDIYINDES